MIFVGSFTLRNFRRRSVSTFSYTIHNSENFAADTVNLHLNTSFAEFPDPASDAVTLAPESSSYIKCFTLKGLIQNKTKVVR